MLFCLILNEKALHLTDVLLRLQISKSVISKPKSKETREHALKSVSQRGRAWRHSFQEALFALHEEVDSYAAPPLAVLPSLSAECTIWVLGDRVCALTQKVRNALPAIKKRRRESAFSTALVPEGEHVLHHKRRRLDQSDAERNEASSMEHSNF